MRCFNFFVLIFIRCYKLGISPYLGERCRFSPTCSDYAFECFQKFSFLKAIWYSILRIIKCHPFCEGGVDPVSKVTSSK